MRRLFTLCIICLFCFGLTAVGAVAGGGLTAAFDGDPLAGALIGGGIGALGGYALNSHHSHHPRHHGWHGGHRAPRHHRHWR